MVTPFLREEVDNPIQCLVCVVGMKGRQYEMPGICKDDGVFHRLAGADLTDQDDVRCLTKSIFERDLKGLGVYTDLTLGNNAAVMLVHELDRVLDGDDVPAAVSIAVSDDGGQ